MGWAVIPHDPIFYFHHNGLDRLRRQWQAKHAYLKPMAYGYPIHAPAYTAAYGTKVGLRDCLGCSAYDAGFTKEILLGTADESLNALPLSGDDHGWVTNEDLLCVLDDVYTFDVISEGPSPAGGGAVAPPVGVSGLAGGIEACDEGDYYAAAFLATLLLALVAVAGWAGGLAWLAGTANSLTARAAPLLILASAFCAGLMSMTAGDLAHRGVPTTTVGAVCGLVGNLLFVALMTAEQPSERPPTQRLLLQGVVGGLLPHLAFFSISHAGLAVANCVMFTMPLWTAVFASLLGGAPWGTRDAMLSAVSLTGVWLVARPTGAVSFSFVGVSAGLGFGACGGLLNVLLGSPSLRGASPSLVSAWQLGATALFAAPSLIALDAPLGDAQCSGSLFLHLGLTGVLMFATSWLRVIGLQRATSSAVATLLYTEIVWAFAFDVLVFLTHPDGLQYAGAGLIIGGATIFALLPEVKSAPARAAEYDIAMNEANEGEDDDP